MYRLAQALGVSCSKCLLLGEILDVQLISIELFIYYDPAVQTNKQNLETLYCFTIPA